jgi:hypothetical protein
VSVGTNPVHPIDELFRAMLITSPTSALPEISDVCASATANPARHNTNIPKTAYIALFIFLFTPFILFKAMGELPSKWKLNHYFCRSANFENNLKVIRASRL